ncbi:hypothetical protein VPH35_073750 [Triticum aestivum]
MACVSSAKYSVKFNGKLLDSFTPSRGLRQGDPLSPFLFLFVADAFSRLISKSMEEDGLKGVNICRGALEISHLLFADDSLLFFQASEQQANLVKGLLNTYAVATGQLINPSKCFILFSDHCSPTVATNIKGVLEITQEVFEPKYLGLPVPEGRMHKGNFETIQERLRKRLIDWSEQYMSSGNKEILIKSVAQAIPAYVMSVFKLLASICDELTRMMRQYWWGVDKGKRKMAWLSWDKMRLPKSMGGMGFRDMRGFNQALLAKQAWRLIDMPDSLCARLLKAKYFPAGNLLDSVFSNNGSAVWKGISYGLDLLKKGVIWRVGDGALIRTWRDPWIPRATSFRPITPKRTSRLNRVSEFLDDNGAWRMDRLREIFWPMDIDYIVKIRTSPRQRSDFVSWFPEKNDQFLVRSAYRLATVDHNIAFAGGASCSAPSGTRSIWNGVWKSSVPQKMKITAWKVVAGALPTAQCKNLRHISTRSTCPLCGVEEEGSFHALVTCNNVRMIWLNMRTRWPLPSDEILIDNGKDWVLHVLANCTDEVRDMVIMLIWRIWQLRTDQTHGKEIPPMEVTVEFLDSYYRSIKLAGRYNTEEIIKGKMTVSAECTGSLVKVKPPNRPWPAPQPGYTALSVDGSFLASDGSAAAGMILRDEEGKIIFSADRYIFHCNDSLEAEIHALMQGMVLAIQNTSLPVIVQLDSAEALSILSNNGLLKSSYGQLVLEIKELMSNREFLPQKIHRSQNCVADRLATYSRLERTTAVWLQSAPPCIEELWPLDYNTITLQ